MALYPCLVVYQGWDSRLEVDVGGGLGCLISPLARSHWLARKYVTPCAIGTALAVGFGACDCFLAFVSICECYPRY